MASVNIKEFKALFTVSDKASPQLKKLKSSFKNFEKASQAFASNASKLGALTLVPLAGAFTAVSATVKSSISTFTDYGSSVKDAAIKLGTTTDAVQTLRHAAQMAGSSTEALDQGMVIFNKNLANAVQGKNKALVEMFQKLGISMKKANGQMKTTAELMPELADAMKRQKNNSEKAYIATTTFGKSGQELIQMLQDGSQALKDYADEAKHLGIVVSDEDTLKAKSMGDTIQRLKDAVTGFSLAIGLKLIPYVEPVIASMTEWIATNREWIATEIASSVKDFVECIKKIDFKQVISQTVTFTKNLVKLFNYLGGVKTVAIVIATIFASKFVVALIGTISAFLKIATAIKAVTVATTLFNIALWSNPIVLIAAAIIAAIAAIVTSVYFLYKNWDTVCKWCKDAWNTFVGFTMSTVTKIKAFFTKMITYILSSLSPIKKALNGIKNWLTNLFNDPVNTIKKTFLSLVGFYANLWGNIIDVTESTIKSCFGGMIDYILDVLSPIKNAWNSMKNWLSNLFNDPVNTIKDTFFSLIDFYVNLWENIRDVTESTLKAVFGEMISYVLNALSPIKAVWEDLKNWLSSLFNDPVNTIKETFLSLVDFYANLWLKIKDVFFAPFESAAKGISKIGSTLSNGWDKTKNFFGFGDESNINVPATTLATASGGALKGDININVKSAEGTIAEVESTSQHGDGRIQYKTNSGVLRSL